jgi:hypothetical protein
MAGGAAAGMAAGAVIYAMGQSMVEALQKTVELFGKDPGMKLTLGVWSGKMLEKLSMGMMSFTDKELRDLATGALETPLTSMGNALADAYLKGVDWAVAGGEWLKKANDKMEEVSGQSVPEHERNILQHGWAWASQHQRGADWRRENMPVAPDSPSTETDGTVEGGGGVKQGEVVGVDGNNVVTFAVDMGPAVAEITLNNVSTGP